MQCQGKTRTGQRCRNRSLDSELFCDIHMRVNHTYNLALLLPVLLGLLAGYFFFFGLFFDTVIFGIFDINYLKYAGIEDLFLNMLRFGAMITFILFVIWISYAVLLFVICGFWLLVRMIIATGQSKLGFVDRLKIIGLSLVVFLLNILLMLVVLFPKRNRKRADKMTLSREKFARSLLEIKDRSGEAIKGKPFINANDIFQNYLYFKSAGNHRFFMTILLLLVVTLGVTYHAGGKAEYARACTLMQSGTQDTERKTVLPFPAFILEGSCQLSSSRNTAEDQSLTSTFISAITGFFDFTPVSIQAPKGQIALLHLATTSRFDLFFNGEDGRSLALPRGTLTLLYADRDGENSSQSVTMLEKQFNQMGRYLSDSNRTLFGIGKDLKKTNEKLSQLSQKETRPAPNRPDRNGNRHPLRAVDTIPASCWKKNPEQLIKFALGSHVITDTKALDLLVRLSVQYRKDQHKSIVILGYTDPSGGVPLNDRLSKQRAQHVTNLLAKLGVNRHRLVPIGMGQNESIRLPQRRVEIRVCDLR